jgi:hypothetical protein
MLPVSFIVIPPRSGAPATRKSGAATAKIFIIDTSANHHASFPSTGNKELNSPVK